MSIHGQPRDVEPDPDMQHIGDLLRAVGISDPSFLRNELHRLSMVAEDIGILCRARGIGNWAAVADVACTVVRSGVERGWADDV